MDAVESILEKKVISGFAPHEAVPVPFSDQLKGQGVICTTPFQAEFEVAAALWEPRLFPICSPFLPAVTDIVRCAARLKLAEYIPGCKVLLSSPRTHGLLTQVLHPR